MRKIESHSQKRNTTSYDLAGCVSPTDLAQIMKDLAALREQVGAWLKEAHPELLQRERFAMQLPGHSLKKVISPRAIVESGAEGSTS